MVPMIFSASGANALLKVVEEPPEHVIFIFATTVPMIFSGSVVAGIDKRR